MKRKIALSFVALLAMVGTSFGALGLGYDWQEVGNGLVQFSIYATGEANTVSNFNTSGGASGGCHQGWHKELDNSFVTTVFWPNPDMASVPELSFGMEFDTHFTSPASGFFIPGNKPTETNSGSSTIILDPTPNPYWNYWGWGQISSGAGDALGWTADPSGKTYFFQAVTSLEDAQSLNTCVYIDTALYNAQFESAQVNLALVVPEPGTVAMLVFGGLCLVGIRLRKKIFSSNN